MSSETLGLLSEDIRVKAVSRMTSPETVSPEARTRIAKMFCKRIESIKSSELSEDTWAGPEQSLRKVAVILRNLSKELRDGLLGAIERKDSETGKVVSALMIIWEDIRQVADRPLQEALRTIDAQKIALALTNADETIIVKIKSNISERAAEMLEEETSLMSAPQKEDIEAAREKIVKVLREMNEKGELSFIEE